MQVISGSTTVQTVGPVLQVPVFQSQWQDIVISFGMLIFIISVLGMVLDDETSVAPLKAAAYSAGQFLVAVANASLGLWISACLLLIGSSLWAVVGWQNK